MILIIEKVLRATLTGISATTNVILASEEVITSTFKMMSADTIVILATKVITATLKKYLNHYKSDLDH